MATRLSRVLDVAIKRAPYFGAVLFGFGPHRHDDASFAQPFFVLFGAAFTDADADQTADESHPRRRS
ncbi:MAG: hypothetical protein ABSD52_02490 [Candidatus Cybelea sp.]